MVEPVVLQLVQVGDRHQHAGDGRLRVAVDDEHVLAMIGRKRLRQRQHHRGFADAAFGVHHGDRITHGLVETPLARASRPAAATDLCPLLRMCAANVAVSRKLTGNDTFAIHSLLSQNACRPERHSSPGRSSDRF